MGEGKRKRAMGGYGRGCGGFDFGGRHEGTKAWRHEGEEEVLRGLRGEGGGGGAGTAGWEKREHGGLLSCDVWTGGSRSEAYGGSLMVVRFWRGVCSVKIEFFDKNIREV